MTAASNDAITFTRAEAELLVRLLGEYQENLEASIEAVVIDGQTNAHDPSDQANLDLDRAAWRRCEDFQIRLTEHFGFTDEDLERILGADITGSAAEAVQHG